ncbi:filamentous hemagglutinin N-terminal domain-containing protein, partial [Burkholderia orbicola]|uniref:two-partner secretion domain-containing protein n=1 Tax=Burkholderia orbicola TaxID=2978683 RepID=UPI002FDF74B9
MKSHLLSIFRFIFSRHQKSARPSRLLVALFARATLAIGGAIGNVYAVGTSEVLGGDARIERPNAAQTIIHQTSDRAVIQWSNFNIGPGEGVSFRQPGEGSATLNQVVSSDPTQILGSLQANGRVFIVNPNGVLFGRGASVDVGGLVASSLGINSGEFMAGKLSFAAGSRQPGLVWVEPGANITAQSFVALLGNLVSNEGNIMAGKDPNANNRGIALVGADAATIQLDGWGVSIDQAAKDALVANSGNLVLGQSMAGGSIQLNAAGRNALMGALLVNTGSITNLSRGPGSETSLTSSGQVLAGGEVKALGGSVEMRGKDVEVVGNVTVGDEQTVDPVVVEVGGTATQSVTQAVDSVITANSKTDAKIFVAAERVLALSGAMFAPGGEISLTSRILDTALLVAIADRVNPVGIEVWTKLPLRTANGLAVYFGRDGHFYSEDGREVDPASHLYDLNGRDVGAYEAGGGSEVLESVGAPLAKFNNPGELVNFIPGVKDAYATNVVVKRGGEWKQVFVVKDSGVSGTSWDASCGKLVDRDGKQVVAGDSVSLWDSKAQKVKQDGAANFTGLMGSGVSGDSTDPVGLLLERGGKFLWVRGSGEGIRELEDGQSFQDLRRAGNPQDVAISLTRKGGSLILAVNVNGVYQGGVAIEQELYKRILAGGVSRANALSPLGNQSVLYVGGIHYVVDGNNGALVELINVGNLRDLSSIFGKNLGVVRVRGRDVVFDRETGIVKNTLSASGDSADAILGLTNLSVGGDAGRIYGKYKNGRIVLVSGDGAELRDGTKVNISDLDEKGRVTRSAEGKVVGGELLLNEKQALEDLGLSQTTLSKDYVTSK